MEKVHRLVDEDALYYPLLEADMLEEKYQILRDEIPHGSERVDFSQKEMEELYQIFTQGDPLDKDSERLCTIMMGRVWKHTTLTGCAQSEWVDCLYMASAYPNGTAELSQAYFNYVSEWQCCAPEDESSDTYFSFQYGSDEIKADLAAQSGLNPEDIDLMESDDYERGHVYRDESGKLVQLITTKGEITLEDLGGEFKITICDSNGICIAQGSVSKTQP